MACIYVACGRDGLVKVGRTSNFKRRLTGLRKEFKRFGNEVIAAHAFDEMSDRVSEVAERRLVSKLSGVFEQYSGREWFIGDPRAAHRAAEIAAHESIFAKPLPIWPTYTAEQLERMRIERAEKRERFAKAKVEQAASRKREVAQRRLLRETRRKEIVQREAVRLGLLAEPKAEQGA